MTVFAFWHHHDSGKVWLEGNVAKQADATFIASSDMVPGYQVPGVLLTDATHDFRIGLAAWLAEHPEALEALRG